MTARTATPQDGLHVDIRLRLGALDLDVALDVAVGETVAVVGPNGAGKSTLLHCIAGLLVPDDGTVRLAGQVLDDVGAGIHVPTSRRRMGVVFPDHLLLPHLTATGNVAFGPRCHGASRRQAEVLARGWLDRVGLAEQADQRPGTLSGGQAQRVALARALAIDPACVLLDEPLSALDVDTRGDVRRVLRGHLAELAGPALLVTHEPVEALALADRLVVLEGGRVTQTGTAGEVARRPRSAWVARLVGVNLLAGTADGTAVQLDGGGTVVVPDVPAGPVLATVHPRSISLHRARPTGSPRNVWSGEVGDVEIVGDRVRVTVAGRPTVVAEVTAAAMAELDLAGGGTVWVSFKATDVEAYPR